MVYSFILLLLILVSFVDADLFKNTDSDGGGILPKGYNHTEVTKTLHLQSYENLVSGTHDSGYNTIFLKCYAPWCPHCQRIALVWDELYTSLSSPTESEDNDLLVAQVDCSDESEGGGKELCNLLNITALPTILYGDLNVAHVVPLKEFSSGDKSNLASLQEFARNKASKLVCAPDHPSLEEACTPDQISQLKLFSDIFLKKKGYLQDKIDKEEQKIADAEQNFKEEYDEMQISYEKLMQIKEVKVAKIRESTQMIQSVIKMRTEVPGFMK